jgi:thioredoxin-like negative regulator of GroEL
MGGGTAIVDRTPATKPQLVYFHSRVSGRARRVEAYLASVLQRRQNHDTFVIQRVIVEDHPNLAEHFQVNGVPTLFVIVSKQVVARIENPRGSLELEEQLRPWLRGGRARAARLTNCDVDDERCKQDKERERDEQGAVLVRLPTDTTE